jgi:tripartite-type tricarboxylate transporter receptor subunit TctC
MSRLDLIVYKLMVGAGALMAATAVAQTWPARPVRIVTAAPGGGTDFMARMVAQALSAALGQAAIVDNRVSGVIQGEIVAQAVPDGYTLLVSSGNLWISGFMQKVPYDAVKDFKPITLAATSPYLLVVNPQVAAKSVRELIALAKARPGELNYVSLSAGSSNHLAGELFKSLAGVNVVRVAYKSIGVGTSDLLSGQVQLMFTSITAASAHIKTGRLRALGVTSAQPTTLFPGLPPVAATVPGYETAAVYGVFARSGVPSAIITKVNQAVAGYFKSAEARERLVNAGAEAVANTPEQFAAMIKVDMARWEKVIREAGIKAE